MVKILVYPKSRRYKRRTRVRGYSKTIIKKDREIKVRPPKEVRKLAEQLKKDLRPFSKKIEIAGSIRRKQPQPYDIDLVLIPKKSKKDDIKNLIKEKGKIKAAGERQIFSDVKGVETDIFFATMDDWGGQLLTRTGPVQGNLGNRTLAKNKGMLLNQYGLFDRKTKKRIAGKTEKEIYEALGKKFKMPELRGK